jgi:hypothetical protein
MIALIILFVIFGILYLYIYRPVIHIKLNNRRIEFFSLVFTAPPSLTIITGMEKEGKEEKIDIIKVVSNIPSDKENNKGNIVSEPSFFHCNEKWPGSLPRPLFQGSCGSCWAFASATCLASRFYIESCGLSGCNNYPQINFGSLDAVNGNLNSLYKFRAVYLSDAFKDIDSDKNGIITRSEWNQIIKQYFDIYNSKGTPISEKHYIAQILVYILNFQSLGSINLDSWPSVEERQNKAFDTWLRFVESFKTLGITAKKAALLDSVPAASPPVPASSLPADDSINIIDLKNAWSNEPITLSAEKMVTCCTKCMQLDFPGATTTTKNMACEGSTLEDAWSMLKESGTPTAMCIGYNLDAYIEGEPIPSCREIQGPFYSFCSGYALDRRSKETPEEWSNNLTKIINKYEDGKIDPVAIPHSEQNLPWVDPQLFRFRSKNVYKINNNMRAIQREILERGPVTSGFVMRESFQNAFGTAGKGGQMYSGEEVPVGSRSKSLIYMYDGDPDDKILGAHAITIVGWGTYNYNKIKIPYWTCLNSWGSEWGTSGFPIGDRTQGPSSLTGGGYFWIIRGLNNCMIEDNVYAGQPDLENVSYPGTVEKYGWGLPGPIKDEVTFIEQPDKSQLKIGPKEILSFEPSLEGGGTYAGRTINGDVSTYFLKSMEEPSPYTLFWTDSRPIYCIGSSINEFSSLLTNDILSVDSATYDIIKKIKQIQPNPLFVLDDEQFQLLDEIGLGETSNAFKVYRGINNSEVSKHQKGSIIKIIPYKNLSVHALDKVSKKCPE